MALIKRAQNLWGKTRKITEPYCVVQEGGWVWKILKAYQSREKEKGNPYARMLCAVYSPATFGGYDMGDVYLRDIPMTAELSAALIERERLEEAAKAE